MITLLLHVLGNSLALYLAARFLEGVTLSPGAGIADILLAGLILGVLNAFVKPVLKFISAPFILLTLGLFIFIINIFILWLLQYLMADTLQIHGFGAYFWTLVIVSLTNFVINHYSAQD